jgi:4-hydroxymandelate oxidase
VATRTTRRAAFTTLGAAARAVLAHPQDIARTAILDRPAPRADLVNVLEYETQARLRLEPAAFARIGGSDRRAFDRITLRPRMLVPTRDLDLGVPLFGDTHASPIVVGPVSNQRAFDPRGEQATIDGAAAAGVGVVLAGDLSLLTSLRRGSSPLWWQMFADEVVRDHIEAVADAGCRAICVTVNAAASPRGARAVTPGTRQWRAVRTAAEIARVPVIVKGVTTPSSARMALENGADGIVFSDYGGLLRPSATSVLDLPAVVDAVGRQVPVFADGSCRRGTDIVKALALGATAVMVARPVMWGLAAYGADGVQGVLQMLQTELARYVAMSGRASLAALDATAIRVHRE